MRVFTYQLFDETISGDDEEWHTPDTFNDVLGAADILSLAAHVSNAAPDTHLRVAVEHSADGEHWDEIATIVDQVVSGNQTFPGHVGFHPINLSLVRLKATLDGSAHQCRLKLFAAGRVV